MDVILALFVAFVVICLFCAFWVGLLMLIIGTIVLIGKLVVWLAYMGFIFITLGVAGLLLVKLCEGIRNFFS